MGKQVGFFASEIDVIGLLEEIKLNRGIVINEDGYELNDFELKNITDIEYCKQRFRFPNFFIIIPSSKLFFEYYQELERKCVNQIFSDVIQFNMCKPSRHNANWFEHGRFWYESKYYIENGSKVNKLEELDVLFSRLSRFIKKNYRLTADKFAYIGPNAFQKYREGVFIPCSSVNLVRVE